MFILFNIFKTLNMFLCSIFSFSNSFFIVIFFLTIFTMFNFSFFSDFVFFFKKKFFCPPNILYGCKQAHSKDLEKFYQKINKRQGVITQNFSAVQAENCKISKNFKKCSKNAKFSSKSRKLFPEKFWPKTHTSILPAR